MTQKEKLLRKQRIKDILLKTLHLICYILSVLFIIVAVVGGVQSCNKQSQKVNAESDYSLNLNHVKKAKINNDSYYVYKFKFLDSPNSFEINRNLQSTLFNNSDYDFNFGYSSEQPQLINLFLIDDCYMLTDTSSLITVNQFAVFFNSLSDDAPIELKKYYYCLYYSVCFYETDNPINYNFFMQRNFDLYDDPDTYHLNVGWHPYLYLRTQPVDDPFLNVFFEPVYESSNLIFNKQWNYNAFLGTNLNGLYGSSSFDSDGENMRYKLYNTGYFVSNGQVFNQIQIWAIQSSGNTVYSVSQGTSGGLMRAPDGYWIYSFIYYRNTFTNYEILVNYHDQIPYSTSSGSTSLYYANSSTWVNDSFRYVTFLEPLSDNLRIQLNAFNNNNQNYLSGQIYNDGYDVFTLLSFGFTSLSEFWSISILPGISIGVLFFLPAVVGVVIIIVHILRK